MENVDFFSLFQGFGIQWLPVDGYWLLRVFF